MTTATRTFAAISLTGFAVGAVVDFGGFTVNPMWTIALPIGAIFLGVALISLVLEKEIARYDAEQAQRIAAARRNIAAETKKTAPTRANLSPYETKAFPVVR